MGYVFSPRYARRQRSGAGDPGAHAALNAALYSPGSHRWVLTEYPGATLADAGRTLKLGTNELCWRQGALQIDLDEREAPLPRRLRARIEVHPVTLSPLGWPLDAAGAHRWYPLVPRARVTVKLLPEGRGWTGTGYLDCNRGPGALQDSFAGWSWLRGHGQNDTTVVYETLAVGSGQCPRRHLLHFNGSGGRTWIGAPPPAQALRRTRWGLARAVACDVGATPRLLRTLEDTPFYARSLLTTQLHGAPLLAIHESLSLLRFQAPWVRVLLPFRSRRSG